MNGQEETELPSVALHKIVELERALANGAFEELGQKSALTAEELREAVQAYGVTLRSDPGSVSGRAIVFQVGPGHFAVDMPLVSLEEGRSQLYVFFDVKMNADEAIVVLEGIGVP